MLPFTETPSEAKLSNNKSVLTYSAFVQEAIEEMLLSGTIKQLKTHHPNYQSSFCFHKFDWQKIINIRSEIC